MNAKRTFAESFIRNEAFCVRYKVSWELFESVPFYDFEWPWGEHSFWDLEVFFFHSVEHWKDFTLKFSVATCSSEPLSVDGPGLEY